MQSKDKARGGGRPLTKQIIAKCALPLLCCHLAFRTSITCGFVNVTYMNYELTIHRNVFDVVQHLFVFEWIVGNITEDVKV